MPIAVESKPVLGSASRTTTQTSQTFTNYMARGVTVILDTTVNAGGLGSITLTINGVDPVSGKTFLLLSGAAVTTVTTNRYTVYPSGIAAVANVTAVDALPYQWNIVVTANNANPMTYSVAAYTLA